MRHSITYIKHIVVTAQTPDVVSHEVKEKWSGRMKRNALVIEEASWTTKNLVKRRQPNRIRISHFLSEKDHFGVVIFFCRSSNSARVYNW